MNCKNCNHDLTGTEISAEFADFAGEQEIYIQVECPECKYVHYTFVPVDQLIIG